MAVRIRLSRVGASHKPFYRIVIADGRAARDGRQIEVVGNYDPKEGFGKAVLKSERVQHWLRCGAQPSAIVQKILKEVAHVRDEKPH